MKKIIVFLSFAFLSVSILKAQWNPDETFVTIPNDGIYLNGHEITVLQNLLKAQNNTLPNEANIAVSPINLARAWANVLAYSPIIGTYNRQQSLNLVSHPENVWFFSYSEEEWEKMKNGQAVFPVLPSQDLLLGAKVYRVFNVTTESTMFFGAVAWESNANQTNQKVFSFQSQRIDNINLYDWLEQCGIFSVTHFNSNNGMHELPSFGSVIFAGGEFYYHNRLGLIQVTGHDEDRYLTSIVVGFNSLAELGISSPTENYHTLNSYQVVTPEGIKTVWVSGATYAGHPEVISLTEQGKQNPTSIMGYFSGVLGAPTASAKGLWVYSKAYGDLWFHDHFYPYIYSQPNYSDVADFERSTGRDFAGGDDLRWRDVSKVAWAENYNEQQKELLDNESWNIWGDEAVVTLPIHPITPSISFDKEKADVYEPVVVSWWAPGESPLIEIDGVTYTDKLMAKSHLFSTPGTHTAMLTIGNKVYRDTIYIRDYMSDYGIERLETDYDVGEDNPRIIWKTVNAPIIRIEGWRDNDSYSNYTRLSLSFKVPGEKKITIRDWNEASVFVIAPGNEMPDPKQLEF